MAILMTAKEFIEKVKEVQKTNTAYMWGTYGQILDNALIDYKANQYPSKNTAARVARHKQLVGKGYSAWDCVGLIKGILWGWEYGKSPKYKGSEVPDVGSDSMYKNYTTHQSTDFKDILPGEVVWIVGHIGVYIGDGLVIEATSRNRDGFTDNVLISALGNHGPVKGYPTRSWTHHGRLRWIDYTAVPQPDPKPEPGKPEDYIIYTVVKGDNLWNIAKRYFGNGNRYKDIMEWNGLKTDLILAGQKLKIYTALDKEPPCDTPDEPEKPSVHTVQVNTTRGLNVRATPNGKILRTLPNKTVVVISKEQKDSTRTWGYTEQYKGWIALDYTVPTSTPAPTPKEYRVRVNTARGLNVRQSATTASKVLRVLGNGTVATIVEERKDNIRTWGKTREHNGWIALDFTVRV